MHPLDCHDMYDDRVPGRRPPSGLRARRGLPPSVIPDDCFCSAAMLRMPALVVLERLLTSMTIHRISFWPIIRLLVGIDAATTPGVLITSLLGPY